MNNLVIMKDRQAVTDSLKVAESFDKKHKNVLQNIQNLAAENSATKKMFVESTYVNRGKEYPMIYMNRDGFTLLAMSFTGKKALDFKLKYIQAFNEMEKRIRQPKSERLEIMRKNSATRRANMLYKIAMATDSTSSKEALLAKAAEVLTGEMTIPVMKVKYYSAGEVGKKLSISAQKVGKIANRLGLKAEQPSQNKYGRWANSKSRYSDKEVPQWLYTDEGIKAIKKELEK